ncbi:hypothetical protein ACJX0J_011459 [Zea mays]
MAEMELYYKKIIKWLQEKCQYLFPATWHPAHIGQKRKKNMHKWNKRGIKLRELEEDILDYWWNQIPLGLWIEIFDLLRIYTLQSQFLHATILVSEWYRNVWYGFVVTKICLVETMCLNYKMTT